MEVEDDVPVVVPDVVFLRREQRRRDRIRFSEEDVRPMGRGAGAVSPVAGLAERNAPVTQAASTNTRLQASTTSAAPEGGSSIGKHSEVTAAAVLPRVLQALRDAVD